VPTDEERMMAREALRALSCSYITRVLEAQKQQPFLVEISAHHIHLTQEHVEALFGKGHQLTNMPTFRNPVSMPARNNSRLLDRKAVSSACASSGPRANTRRSRSQ
jgi:acetate kinase